MSLKEQLSTLKAQNIAKLPNDAVAVLLADAKKLGESGIVEGAPKVGEKLKDFRDYLTESIIPHIYNLFDGFILYKGLIKSIEKVEIATGDIYVKTSGAKEVRI